MKVNVICDEANAGWIYSKFIIQLGLHSENKIFVNTKEKCDVRHYLPYYAIPKHPTHPSTAWFSHREAKDPLKSQFVSAAKQCDWCLSPSLKYANVLYQNGITKVSQVKHGVDLERFKLRSSTRPKSNKLVLGWVGRSYQSSSRKNEQLLRKLAALDFVDLVITGGKVKEADMPEFYHSLDAVVSPSLVEGGPMAITEGLACGVPILCYADVGVADEFEHGVLRSPLGNEMVFVQRIKDFWSSKEYDHFRQPEQLCLLRSQVETHTWANFVIAHDSIWESVCG